jgi:hypothetical protein
MWLLFSIWDKVGRPFFEQLNYFVDNLHIMANSNRPFYIPGNNHYFLEDWNGKLSTDSFHNYIDYEIPQEYIAAGMVDTGVLRNDQDFITNTIFVNPALTQALFADKIESCGGHIITWALPPTSFAFKYTTRFYLGRVP